MPPRARNENGYDADLVAFAKQDEIRATLALASAHTPATAVKLPIKPYGPWHDAAKKLQSQGWVMRSDRGLYLTKEDETTLRTSKSLALSRFLLGYRPLPEDEEAVLFHSTAECQAAMLLFLYFAGSSTWLERALKLMGGRYDDDTPASVADLEQKKLISDIWNRPSSPCHELTLKGRSVVEAWLYAERRRLPFPFSSIRPRSSNPRQKPAAQALRGRLPFEVLGQHELEELTADFARRVLRLADVHIVGSGNQEGKDVQGWTDVHHAIPPVVLQAKSTASRTLAKPIVTRELKLHGSTIESTSRYYFVTNARLDAASQKLVVDAGAKFGVPTTPVARPELEDFLTQPSNLDLIARYFPTQQLPHRPATSAPRKDLSDTNQRYRIREIARVALNREWGRELTIKDLEGEALQGVEEPWGCTSWKKQFTRAGHDALEVVVADQVIFRLPYENIVLLDETRDTIYIVCPERVQGLLDAVEPNS